VACDYWKDHFFRPYVELSDRRQGKAKSGVHSRQWRLHYVTTTGTFVIVRVLNECDWIGLSTVTGSEENETTKKKNTVSSVIPTR